MTTGVGHDGGGAATWPGMPGAAGPSPVPGRSASDGASDGPRRRRSRWGSRRLAGTVLALLWAAWIGGAAWGGPWHGTPEALRADLDAGSVRSWQLEHTSPRDPLTGTGYLVGGGQGTSVSADREATFVVWRDRYDRIRWVDGRLLKVPVTPAVPSQEVQYEPALRAWLADRTTPSPGGTFTSWWNLVGGAFWVLGVLTVLLGPALRHGNRWFWFWVSGITMGVGLLAYALVECLIARAPQHPHRPRLGGVVGFLTVIIGAPLVSMVGGLALGALGLL